MGCNSSRPTSDINGPIESTKSNKPYHTKTHGQTRMSKTETKINQALLKKKLEHAVEDKPLTFERLLLKFDKIRNVVGYVKNVFNQVATEGKLDNTGLEMCMKRLGVKMSLEDILDLFDFIDVQAQSVITIKEFLVALTIGMVLEVIPALSKPTTEGKPLIKRSFSGFLGHQSEIKEMLNLIVSAYLIFDPQAKGYIERQNVTTMLDEQEGRNKKGSNVILSEQRWKEMDWDASGKIDFAEFVYTFALWLEIEEDEDDDTDDNNDHNDNKF